MLTKQSYILASVCGVLGVLIVLQAKSFQEVDSLRDFDSNVFQEISVIKEKNDDLRREIGELEINLDNLSSQNSVLKAIEDEVRKYKKLSGRFPVFGPGLEISIEGEISTPWLVDLVNALFGAGAEAVAVNGIRITNQSNGFDTLPQGQILLNGSTLSSPYAISALGDSSGLSDIIRLPGGIFERLKASLPNLKLNIEEKDVLQMD